MHLFLQEQVHKIKDKSDLDLKGRDYLGGA